MESDRRIRACAVCHSEPSSGLQPPRARRACPERSEGITSFAFREEMAQKRVPQASACSPFVGTG